MRRLSRIPLLVRYPKQFARGSKPDDFVLSIDVAASVLSLAGIPFPRQFHGRPLWSRPGRDAVLVECFDDTVFPRIRNMGYSAVRTSRWKYIHYWALPASDELYDLKTDPYELVNRIGDRVATGSHEAAPERPLGRKRRFTTRIVKNGIRDIEPSHAYSAQRFQSHSPKRRMLATPTETIAWLLPYIYLDTYMLCGVYQESGIRVRNHCGAEPPRDIEPSGLVTTVGWRDRASASYAAADRVKAPASAARGRFRGIHGGRTAPSLPAET